MTNCEISLLVIHIFKSFIVHKQLCIKPTGFLVFAIKVDRTSVGLIQSCDVTVSKAQTGTKLDSKLSTPMITVDPNPI